MKGVNDNGFPDLPHQRGFATRRQLLDAGSTPSALRQLSRNGHHVARAVYGADGGALREEDRVIAGYLWAGKSAVLTGVNALIRLGIAVPRPATVIGFLVVAGARNRRHIQGFRTIRTRRPPKARPRDGVPTAPIERALADAGRHRELTASELKGLTIAVLQRRLTTPERLVAELEAGGTLGVTGVRQGLMAFCDGSWSVPEATLAGAVAEHSDLPVMLANPTLLDAAGAVIGVPDGYFPDAGVVVQVHSRAYHDGVTDEGDDRWTATVEGDLRYPEHGLLVVPVTPETLRDSLPGFLDSLAAILATRDGPAPHVFVRTPPAA